MPVSYTPLDVYKRQVELVAPLAVGDLRGETVDHARVGDVLLLRGHRHQQVAAHQPFDQRAVGLRQPVRQAEGARIDGAELGMIAAAALGDVVEPVSYTHLDVYKRQLSPD